MNYLDTFKSLSKYFIESTHLTMEKEVLFKSFTGHQYVYFKIDDLPEILEGKYFYNIPNLIKILSDKITSITEEKIDENNGILNVQLGGKTTVKLPFSYQRSPKNLKKESRESFLNVAKKDTNYFEFKLSLETINDIKKFQNMFKTKDIVLSTVKNDCVSFEVKAITNDKYLNAIETTHNGDFSISYAVEDLPSSDVIVRISKFEKKDDKDNLVVKYIMSYTYDNVIIHTNFNPEN